MMSAATAASTAMRETAPASSVRDFVELLKPGVMSLVVFTGFAGLIAAPGNLHPFLAVITISCIALGAGAAGAINMWYDRDIDAIMTRTQKRPIPSGRIEAPTVLEFGVVVSLGSVLLLGVAVNWLAAGILGLSIGFYVFVYTMWLKRRTPMNIVIGGAAGAFPPMIGWTAVTGSLAWEPLLMFAIIFLWTPPHFWALALYRCQDYARARVPMLPVTHGVETTKRQMLLYTLALLAFSLAPCVFGMRHLLYGTGALLLGLRFIQHAWAVMKAAEANKLSMRMFGFSIVHLFALFTFYMADKLVYGI